MTPTRDKKFGALVRWAVRFYNGDTLFVELSRAERNRIDRQLCKILDGLGVEFDGMRRGPAAPQVQPLVGGPRCRSGTPALSSSVE